MGVLAGHPPLAHSSWSRTGNQTLCSDPEARVGPEPMVSGSGVGMGQGNTDGWMKHPSITVSVPFPGLITSAATHLFIMQVSFFPHMTSKPLTP